MLYPAPRMKADDYKSIYIVKLPNNFCGIGACVIKHPSQVNYTADENIICAPKMRIKFWCSIKLIIFTILQQQYCPFSSKSCSSLHHFLYRFCTIDSWLLFCIALRIDIALPTIAIAIVGRAILYK